MTSPEVSDKKNLNWQSVIFSILSDLISVSGIAAIVSTSMRLALLHGKITGAELSINTLLVLIIFCLCKMVIRTILRKKGKNPICKTTVILDVLLLGSLILLLYGISFWQISADSLVK